MPIGVQMAWEGNVDAMNTKRTSLILCPASYLWETRLQDTIKERGALVRMDGWHHITAERNRREEKEERGESERAKILSR